MTDDEKMVSLKDVERELGLSRITLHRWIKSGKLLAVKVGRDWRVRRSVLDELKENGT